MPLYLIPISHILHGYFDMFGVSDSFRGYSRMSMATTPYLVGVDMSAMLYSLPELSLLIMTNCQGCLSHMFTLHECILVSDFCTLNSINFQILVQV